MGNVGGVFPHIVPSWLMRDSQVTLTPRQETSFTKRVDTDTVIIISLSFTSVYDFLYSTIHSPITGFYYTYCISIVRTMWLWKDFEIKRTNNNRYDFLTSVHRTKFVCKKNSQYALSQTVLKVVGILGFIRGHQGERGPFPRRLANGGVFALKNTVCACIYYFSNTRWREPTEVGFDKWC